MGILFTSIHGQLDQGEDEEWEYIDDAVDYDVDDEDDANDDDDEDDNDDNDDDPNRHLLPFLPPHSCALSLSAAVKPLYSSSLYSFLSFLFCPYCCCYCCCCFFGFIS